MTNPLAWLLLLTVVGWLLQRRLTWFAGACAGGAALLLLLMTQPIAYALTHWWEAEFAPKAACQNEPPDLLVLLPGGIRGAQFSQGERGISTLTLRSLLRLEHALALSVQHAGVPIVVAGTRQETVALRQVAEQWGSASLLIDLAGSKNTIQAAEAVSQHPLARGSNIWLVTSALHMRRSWGAFKHFGLDVCPVGMDQTQGWRGVLPDYRSVGRLDALLHEWAGLAYYQLRYWLA